MHDRQNGVSGCSSRCGCGGSSFQRGRINRRDLLQLAGGGALTLGASGLRVMAGPFADFDAAEKLCAQLEASDQYCAVLPLNDSPAQ